MTSEVFGELLAQPANINFSISFYFSEHCTPNPCAQHRQFSSKLRVTRTHNETKSIRFIRLWFKLLRGECDGYFSLSRNKHIFQHFTKQFICTKSGLNYTKFPSPTHSWRPNWALWSFFMIKNVIQKRKILHPYLENAADESWLFASLFVGCAFIRTNLSDNDELWYK